MINYSSYSLNLTHSGFYSSRKKLKETPREKFFNNDQVNSSISDLFDRQQKRGYKDTIKRY